MRSLVLFSVLFFGGFVGAYVLLSVAGVEGWWVFGLLSLLFVGGSGLFVLAREGLHLQDGYRRWRRTVWLLQNVLNTDLPGVGLDKLVKVLDDPVLTELYASRQRSQARDLERRQNGGDHSER